MLRLLGERPVAPQAIDGTVAGRRHEPGTRFGRCPVSRPPFRGDRERLLRGFLGQIDIAEERDKAGDDPAPLLTKDLIEQR
jgi:hypothetical protein